MARPKKPPVGTAARLQMDIADYGETYRFVRNHIKKAGGKRGDRHKAIEQAAKAFSIDYKTAERRYERIKKFDTPEGLNLMAADAIAKQKPEVDAALSIIRSAFSPEEMEQLAAAGSDFVYELAKGKLELIELQKRRKRK